MAIYRVSSKTRKSVCSQKMHLFRRPTCKYVKIVPMVPNWSQWMEMLCKSGG